MNVGKETEQIEFKRSTSELKEGIISITSILNAHGYGELYFGVNNSGDVVGQILGKETERDVSSTIRNSIEPNCEFNIEAKTSEDDKTYLHISFRGDRAPYMAYGRFYIRHSDEDHLMSPSEIEAYFKKKSN